MTASSASAYVPRGCNYRSCSNTVMSTIPMAVVIRKRGSIRIGSLANLREERSYPPVIPLESVDHNIEGSSGPISAVSSKDERTKCG